MHFAHGIAVLHSESLLYTLVWHCVLSPSSLLNSLPGLFKSGWLSCSQMRWRMRHICIRQQSHFLLSLSMGISLYLV